jgi:hypothetical protein
MIKKYSPWPCLILLFWTGVFLLTIGLVHLHGRWQESRKSATSLKETSLFPDELSVNK